MSGTSFQRKVSVNISGTPCWLYIYAYFYKNRLVTIGIKPVPIYLLHYGKIDLHQNEKNDNTVNSWLSAGLTGVTIAVNQTCG